MTDAWSVERTQDGASVDGEIDWENSAQIAKLLYEAAKDAEGPFTIDLSAVTFMDSSGLSALTRVVDVCPGTNFVIRSSRHAFTMLELAGMASGDWPNVTVVPPEDPPDPAT
jgi:anti-anti-sigma factor